MTLTKKIQSEVYATIDSYSISQTTGYVKFNLDYYHQYTDHNAKLEKFQYDDGSGWKDCLQPDDNLVSGVSSSPNVRKVMLYWDAATDLGCCSEHTNVDIRITFMDRESGGTESDPITTTISSIDFRTTEVPDTLITRPKDYDPYFDTDFNNPEFIRNTKLHFVYEIATDEDFSNIVFTKNTSNSVTDWQADSLTFPTSGIDGLNTHNIIYDGNAPTDPDITDGSNYYYRIRIVTSCPSYQSFTVDADIISDAKKHGLNTYPFVWFKDASESILTPLNYIVDYIDSDKFNINFGESIANAIDVFYGTVTPTSQAVSSQSSISINHNLGYNPWIWFKNSDGEIETPAQFEVIYDDTNNLTVNFYENRTGTLYYNMGSTAANTDSITSGNQTKEITHNLGHYPFFWFEKDSDGSVYSPAQFEVTYNSIIKATIDFGESLSDNYTIYYR